MATNKPRQRKALPQQTQDELETFGTTQRQQAQARTQSNRLRDQRAFAGNHDDPGYVGIVGQMVSELHRGIRRSAVASGERVDDDRAGFGRPASQPSRPARANIRSTSHVRARSTLPISLRSAAVLAMWREANRAADS